MYVLYALTDAPADLPPPQCGVPLLLDRIKQGMVSCRVSGTLCARRICSHAPWIGSVGVLQEAGDDRRGVRQDAAEARALNVRCVRT